jgi:hypothetical protein
MVVILGNSGYCNKIPWAGYLINNRIVTVMRLGSLRPTVLVSSYGLFLGLQRHILLVSSHGERTRAAFIRVLIPFMKILLSRSTHLSKTSSLDNIMWWLGFNIWIFRGQKHSDCSSASVLENPDCCSNGFYFFNLGASLLFFWKGKFKYSSILSLLLNPRPVKKLKTLNSTMGNKKMFQTFYPWLWTVVSYSTTFFECLPYEKIYSNSHLHLLYIYNLYVDCTVLKYIYLWVMLLQSCYKMYKT